MKPFGGDIYDTMTNCSKPPKYRFCDLVMKGGIASGVVYPMAIEELSHNYHFHQNFEFGGRSCTVQSLERTMARPLHYEFPGPPYHL